MLGYELFSARRVASSLEKEVGDDDDDGFSRTTTDDLVAWIKGSQTLLMIGMLNLTFGVHTLISPFMRSTFFCSKSDAVLLIGFLQGFGLFLDAAIIVLSWRILAWARTTKIRLRTISSVLLSASLSIGLFTAASSVFGRGLPPSPVLAKGLGSLYTLDVTVDSMAISILVISAALYICESPPSTLATPVAYLCGMFGAAEKLSVGGFLHLSRTDVLLPLQLLGLGFTTFLFLRPMRHVVFIHRALVVLAVFAILCGTTTFAVLMDRDHRTRSDHSVRRLIYDARVQQDRWLTHASVSKSLRVAVTEYRERNLNRDPPPGFDVWYQFALDRKSLVIDHFETIRNDLEPFWRMKPGTIRKYTKDMSAEPDIALLTIQNGAASHSLPSDRPQKVVLDSLAELVNTFAHHLPDMQLAINLDERPRVMVPWDNLHGRAETRTHFESRAGVSADGQPAVPPGVLSARQVRHMSAIACPPTTATRGGVYWNTRDFDGECVWRHSRGQFLDDWQRQLDICNQPDLLRLHGFFMTAPKHVPLQELVPVFGRSKAQGYNDILIPLPWPTELQAVDTTAPTNMKDGKLFWRGKLDTRAMSHDLFHGGQQQRLVHLANNASASDELRLLLPALSDSNRWSYQRAPAAEVKAALRLDVGFSGYGPCDNRACERAQAEFGLRAETNPLENRYVMLPDTDAGPSPNVLPAVRSTSIPFVASVFQEWFSERLRPWLHFVPVDLRYHGLHSTLAYFSGLTSQHPLNGRDPGMGAAGADGDWIADEGRKWANKAVRIEDAEVYLFRLLLEWARIIDDGRDGLGFKLEK